MSEATDSSIENVEPQPAPEHEFKMADALTRLLIAENEARYWRDRCARYEAGHERIEKAAAEVRARFEQFINEQMETTILEIRAKVNQFMVTLQTGRPQGTDRTASSDEAKQKG